MKLSPVSFAKGHAVGYAIVEELGPRAVADALRSTERLQRRAGRAFRRNRARVRRAAAA